MRNWDTFLAEATDVFVAKNTDYDSRFMRALIQYNDTRGYEAARSIWAWEVEKKLDRCRSWVTRGQLLVQDEGVKDSVIDLFNYTVQYRIFRTAGNNDPLTLLDEGAFYEHAAVPDAQYWIGYLIAEKLLSPSEERLYQLLLEEMTGAPF